jgi:hypothetical protein
MSAVGVAVWCRTCVRATTYDGRWFDCPDCGLRREASVLFDALWVALCLGESRLDPATGPAGRLALVAALVERVWIQRDSVRLEIRPMALDGAVANLLTVRDGPTWTRRMY